MTHDPVAAPGRASDAPRHGSRLVTLISERTLRNRLLAGAASLAFLAGAFGGPLADAAARAGEPTAAAASVSMPDFVPLVKALKPAVVSVRVKSRMSDGQSLQMPQGNPFEGTPFERFFRPFGEPQMGRPGAPQPHLMRAQGSGFFISADGYLVTNNHVVDKALEVEVVMDDASTVKAKVIGTDPKTDIALLKVSGRTDLPYVKLAAGTPPIGSWVLAMGNPFGLGGTVTAGIVSAKGRDIGNGPYDDYIQIDAPVNRGNSGGPSFDMKGEVIGINTAIYSPSGGSVGIAFDIPAPVVRSVVEQLRTNGHVERGWLGVEVQPVTRAIADSIGLAKAEGALISEPQPASPAAKAGLKSGDVITAVNDKAITSARDLARNIAAIPPGSSARLTVMHDGSERQVTVTLGKLDDKVASSDTGGKGANGDVGKLGLTVAPAASVDGAGEEGLAVLSVDPDGQAAELGVQAGDVILKAGGRSIASVQDLRTALAEARHSGKKHALALIRHDKSERYVALPVHVG